VLAQSLAVGTRAGYRLAVNNIAAFHERNHSPFVFPVSADTLCLWMADSTQKLRYSSIRNYLHGIATTQMELGFASPLLQSPLIWRMFKAIKRIQGQQVVRKRLPITVKILSQIDHLFDTSKESDLCMRAAMWFGTCGLLRAGEFVSKPATRHTLKLNHLTFHDANNSELDPLHLNGQVPAYMSVRIEQSKTDPFRQGTTVVIGNERAFATCWHTCSIVSNRLLDCLCSSVTTANRSHVERWSSSHRHSSTALTSPTLISFWATHFAKEARPHCMKQAILTH